MTRDGWPRTLGTVIREHSKESPVHMQVITFQLKDMPVDEFYGLCDALAPQWAAIPGLISKVWLQDAETNTYGGVYTWESREAMDAFVASDLFNAVATNPNFVNAASVGYGVIEAPTRVTRGFATVAV
jgi:quinol monooxygenase YgiN